MVKFLMCSPDHFQVAYQINPWMEMGQVDGELAVNQWSHLKQVYHNLGAEVFVITQEAGWPDMVFAADQGFVLNKRVVMSRFHFTERQGETAYYREWFTTHGYTLVDLPDGVYYEGGGETLRFRDILLVGSGFRTSHEGVEALRQVVEIDVVEIPLVDPRFYHLDTCLFPLDDQTLFYFPHAFSDQGIAKLRSFGAELVELTIDDVLQFAANCVVIDRHVVMQAGNEQLAYEVSKHGYIPVMVDVGEFLKAGGGIHCLTMMLEY